MTRRVVLVDFYWTRDQDPRVPLGHASLLSALRDTGVGDIRSMAMPVNIGVIDVDAVAERMLNEAAGWPPEQVDIAIGAYVWAEELIQNVLPRLRARGFSGVELHVV